MSLVVAMRLSQIERNETQRYPKISSHDNGKSSRWNWNSYLELFLLLPLNLGMREDHWMRKEQHRFCLKTVEVSSRLVVNLNGLGESWRRRRRVGVVIRGSSSSVR